MLGPRSALFAPVERLGLVVVDEEHDPAFKQEHSPRYHGRDLALVRAQRGRRGGHPGVGDAELRERGATRERGKLIACELPQRVGGGRLPEGILVDLREEPAARKPGEVALLGTAARRDRAPRSTAATR